MPVVNGTEGNDEINDTSGNDTINGLGGNDLITIRQGGLDTVDGGAGVDDLLLDVRTLNQLPPFNGAITLTISADNANGVSGHASWSTRTVDFVRIESIRVASDYADVADTVTTGSGNDQFISAALTLTSLDLVNLGAGDDLFGAGYRYYSPPNNAAVALSFTSVDANGYNGFFGLPGGFGYQFSGVDRFDVQGSLGNENWTGGSGDDRLNGGGGEDILDGGGGDDVLETWAGDNYSSPSTLIGGEGNDKLQGARFDTMIGGEGNDELSSFYGGGPSGGMMDGGNGDDILTNFADNAPSMFGGAGNDTLLGYNGSDTLDGGDGNDTLDGIYGSDILNGGAGDDLMIIASANGHDQAHGGVGTDWLSANFFNAYMAVTSGPSTPNAAGGFDGTFSSDSLSVAFTSIERISIGGGEFADSIITGGGDDQIALREGNDTANAGAGNDYLDGGAGNDILIGGTGDDVYIADSLNDVVTENAGEGFDQIRTALSSYSLASANVEMLVALGTGQRLTGNLLDNTIQGGSGSDALIGLGGHDTLVGGAGDDGYIVEDAFDTIVEGAGGGYDTVYTTASFTLNGGAEIETLSVYERTTTNALNLAGNGFGQTIYGNNGINSLNGNGGVDVLYGLGGDDAYLVDWFDDLVVEATGGGSDTVYALADFALATGSQIEVLTAYDRATGSPVRLSGNEYGNTIYGNAGTNALTGGGGADTLYGMGGDDGYFVDWLDDTVIEFAGGGTDTVYTTGSHALTSGSEVEVLTVYDRATTGAINLTGNEFANTIYGNAGANEIDGRGGSDTIYLMGGTDIVSFSAPLGSGNVDAIIGFLSGNDKLLLDHATFAGLGSSLPASAFVIGPSAGDADDRIVYNQASGQLLFDSDGNGAGAAVLFATLDPGAVLAASDFLVV